MNFSSFPHLSLQGLGYSRIIFVSSSIRASRQAPGIHLLETWLYMERLLNSMTPRRPGNNATGFFTISPTINANEASITLNVTQVAYEILPSQTARSGFSELQRVCGISCFRFHSCKFATSTRSFMESVRSIKLFLPTE